MKKDKLNHYLTSNDGYGEFEHLVASQANGAGTKKLVLVTVISVGQTQSYFKLLHKKLGRFINIEKINSTKDNILKIILVLKSNTLNNIKSLINNYFRRFISIIKNHKIIKSNIRSKNISIYID